MSLEIKHTHKHERGEYDGTNMCSWRLVCFLPLGWHILESGSNWQAVLRMVRWIKRGWLGGWHILENGVVGKLYCVRSDDENAGGSVVDIFFENGSDWQAVQRTVCWRKCGWFSGWHAWKTEVIGKLYYVQSVDETRVVRWVFFFVLRIRFFFVVCYGVREAELERLNDCL